MWVIERLKELIFSCNSTEIIIDLKSQIEKIENENQDLRGIIKLIGEELKKYECEHGVNLDGTPPMFYPELIKCIMNKSKQSVEER